ncbi:hypothetical protein L6258_03575 [Candidatus Parcubacteria bacterium]|nr:hypothetical protein [Candidatus Parcubacteria bacterium]
MNTRTNATTTTITMMIQSRVRRIDSDWIGSACASGRYGRPSRRASMAFLMESSIPSPQYPRLNLGIFFSSLPVLLSFY